MFFSQGWAIPFNNTPATILRSVKKKDLRQSELESALGGLVTSGGTDINIARRAAVARKPFGD